LPLSTLESSLSATAAATSPSRGLRYTLWGFQLLLGLMMLGAGGAKATLPLDELAVNMPWIPSVPGWVPRLAGGAEVLGAIGLVAPSATRILPILTPVAAACLALVMALGVGMHLSLGEGIAAAAPAAVLTTLFLFVAWGRGLGAPISAR
jgi:putative oxidoreductase